MHRIERKEQLAPDICLLELTAPDIAAAARPGQFLVLRVDERGERFPLTIYDLDPDSGTVTVVCQAVGVSTKKLCALREGDRVLDIAGPLGHAVDTSRVGRVMMIGGGVGTAEAYPIAKAMKEAGNHTTAIIGARTAELVLCEDEMRGFCDEVFVATDDGSRGRKGFVTDILRDLLEKAEYDLVFAIGPVLMMKAVADVTRPCGIKTYVSLNSIMIDGTGMCGGCRVISGGSTSFTCVDGPEYDAHEMDFDDLIKRQSRYVNKEKRALDEYEEHCRLGIPRAKNGGHDGPDK